MQLADPTFLTEDMVDRRDRERSRHSRLPQKLAALSRLRPMLHPAQMSEPNHCLRLARKRLIVTGVTPRKDAINEWVKMSS